MNYYKAGLGADLVIGFPFMAIPMGLVKAVDGHIRKQAAEGARAAVAPVARKEAAAGARAAVTPYLVGVAALSGIAILLAVRK